MKAPTRLPTQPQIAMGIPCGTTAPRSMYGSTANSGATIAAKVGHFALRPRFPLGATQNWQNARYGVPTRQAARISRIEFCPGTSTSDAAQKKTMSAVIPITNERMTLRRVNHACVWYVCMVEAYQRHCHGC